MVTSPTCHSNGDFYTFIESVLIFCDIFQVPVKIMLMHVIYLILAVNDYEVISCYDKPFPRFLLKQNVFQ